MQARSAKSRITGVKPVQQFLLLTQKMTKIRIKEQFYQSHTAAPRGKKMLFSRSKMSLSLNGQVAITINLLAMILQICILLH